MWELIGRARKGPFWNAAPEMVERPENNLLKLSKALDARDIKIAVCKLHSSLPILHLESFLLSDLIGITNMSSRRERVPLSGRSNVSSARREGRVVGVGIGGGIGSNSVSARSRGPQVSSRMNSARSNFSDTSLPTARKEELNNPLEVFRPYSPEVTVSDSHLRRPAILPKNRHSTNPPMDPTLGVAKARKHSVCPEGFIEQNLAPSWFETLDQAAALLDIESKVVHCRDFVERNRDRLWKYDLDFRGLTPRSVVDKMMKEEGLLTRMQKFNKIERAVKLSSSEQFKASFNDDKLGASKSVIKSDPYLMSYDTPRATRNLQMTNLMTNNGGAGGDILQHGRKNQRGYKHTTGFGNFSNFNGLLQLNKNCALNR